jgi:dTDP-4-dehydrorhamnose reductase
MNILIIGKNGQLGYELQQATPKNYNAFIFGSAELNIKNKEQINSTFALIKPDVVINASAYTAVDKAETDEQEAYAVNEQGCKNLAEQCKNHKAKLIHVSTDFVFDGCKNTPYTPQDNTSPIGAYGASKLAGEKQIQAILPQNHIIIRTAWVYSLHGNNFVKTMLRLMAEKEQLGVVYDQIGTPTWAKNLAEAIWLFVGNNALINGDIHHWTDAGVTSWYDFAVTIQELAVEKGILAKPIPIKPIPASGYPTPAKRPSYSVLDKTSIEKTLNIECKHWRSQLSEMLNLISKK